VANAGWLRVFRLSVTTSEKVTCPAVLGTVTKAVGLVFGAGVDGLVGDNGMGEFVPVVPMGMVPTGIEPMGSVPIGAVGRLTGSVAAGVVAAGVEIPDADGVTTGSGVGTGNFGGVGICHLLAGTRYQLFGCTRVQRYDVIVPDGAVEAPPSNKMESPTFTAAGALILAIGLAYS
jgi:hypothetical protein